MVGQVKEERRLRWMVGDHFNHFLGQQVCQELLVAFKGDVFTIMEVLTESLRLLVAIW